MESALIKNPRKAVMLDNSTQIEIMKLLYIGHTYEEIDRHLEVPRGSSQYTINTVRGCEDSG